LSIRFFSLPKNRPVEFIRVVVVEVVVSVEVVVVAVGDVVVVVVGVEVVVEPEDDVVVVVLVEATGAVIFAGFCAASKAAQSTPISLPSEAAFLYGLLDPK
jgi:hypothetical protein